MTTTNTTFRVVAFGLLVFGAAVSSVLAARGRQASSSEQLVDGPATWVAFQASYRAVSGGVETRGTIARASNGSERHDVYGMNDATPRAITIINIPLQTMYSLISTTAGEQHFQMRTIILPRAGYTPKRRLSLESKTVAKKTPVQFGQWSAFETISDAKGDPQARLFIAPDLNFFPVRIVQGDWQRELSDVVLGEPDPSLFLLPPGAKISRTGPPARLGQFTVQELGGIAAARKQ
jgi:hypothetical protein